MGAGAGSPLPLAWVSAGSEYSDGCDDDDDDDGFENSYVDMDYDSSY